MNIKHFALAVFAAGIFGIPGFSQGTVVLYDPVTAASEPKYELTPAEKAIMDKDVLPKVRAKLAGDACEETIEIAGRGHGSFTKAGAKQTFIFYQFCQTGNGLGSAGVAIIDGGRLVGSFVSRDAGWAVDAATIADIHQNGLDEITLFYSGGLHQGGGGTGVDIVEYSGGALKGIGWFQAEEFSEDSPVQGYKVSAKPGKVPALFREEYTQNAAGKWRKSSKVMALKMMAVNGTFETIK